MPHRLRILHISDLHERVESGRKKKDKEKIRANAASRYRVLGDDRFFSKLEEIKNEYPIDLVCFTGDVADWALPQEYDLATNRFEQIKKITGVPFERFFVVPGNHDINRSVEKNAWNKMRELAANGNLYGELCGWMAGGKPPYGAQKEWRGKLLRRNKAFWNWVETALGQGQLLPANNPHPLGYRVAVPALPFPVTIAGLDSAWLAGDKHDARKLLLTDKQVDLLTLNAGGRFLNGFRLALMHHPLGDLCDELPCRNRLADSVDLLLHGHQHTTIAHEFKDMDRSLRVLAAGSLYEGDMGDKSHNSFHVIDVYANDEGRPLQYDLSFWGWSKDRLFWHPDNSIYEKAENGRATWWTELGETEQGAKEAARRLDKAPELLQRQKPFIGREEHLAALTATLLDSDKKPVCAISSVQGMGGVGKSYLAAEFIGRHAGSFPGGVERLILARDDAREYPALLQDVCNALDLPLLAPDKRAALLHEHLLNPPALFLIENVDGHDQARAVARLVSRLGGCRVLVTGRYQGLGEAADWKQVQVKPFNEEEAFAQLCAEHKTPESQEEELEFRSLVRTLGCLPLAVHIAAGYLRRPAQTCAGFLIRMRDAGWGEGPRDDADPVAAHRAKGIIKDVFEISFSALRSCFGDRGEDMFAAYRRLGFAPAAGFGASLGAAIAGLAGEDFEALAVEACDLSILDPDKDPANPAARRFRVHPLLAELLQAGAGPSAVLDGMTGWFCERFPEPEQWNEVHAEHHALAAWLRQIAKLARDGTLPEEELVVIERAASKFAMTCGPFQL